MKIDLQEVRLKNEENLPHIVSEVMCWKCGHRWISVRPEKTLLKQLECPECSYAGFAFNTGEDIDGH